VSENTMGGTNGEGLLGMGVYATGGTISGCTIKDNVSYNNDAPTPTFKGPGMYVAGAVTVTNTTISGNVGYDGFGGGIYHASGKLLVADSKIINNRCPSGAGIYSASGNDLTIERCVITNNIGWLDSGEKSPNVYYAANTTPTIVDSTIGRGGTAPVRTAKTYVVSAAAFPDHEPVYPYSSWATAATDIQAAVDATDDGGVCTVSNGTYTVYNSVVVDRALTLVSAEGNAVTTICGANDAAKALLPCAYRALLVNHAEAVVKGFTLTGGGYTENWGFYVSSFYGTLLTVGGLGGLVTDCVFSGNGCGRCTLGNIYLAGPNAVVSNCVARNTGASGNNYHKPYGYVLAMADGLFTHSEISGTRGKANSAASGFAAYLSGGRISHCVITNNVCGETFNGTVYLAGANAVVDNSLIAGNTLGSDTKATLQGGGVYATAGKVVNCTIIDNKAGTGGGIYANNKDVKVHNTLLQGNTVFTANPNFYGTATVYTHSLCPDALPTADSGNVQGTAVFEANKGYRLASGSPGCDAGDSTTYEEYVGTTDLDGKTRVWGDEVDIGCYEYILEKAFSGSIVPPEGSVLAGEQVTFRATIVNPQHLVLTQTWSVDGSSDEPFVGEEFKPTFTAPGNYTVRLVISDGKVQENKDYAFCVYPTDLYVVPPDPEHESVPPYASWQTAATNLLDAVAAAADRCVIHLAPGTHPVRAEVAIEAAITVVGDAGAEQTVVRRASGNWENKHRVFNLNHAKAVVRGLTIQNGRLDSQHAYGAGVYIGGKGGTLADCIVSGNTMTMNMYTYGTGVYMYSGLVTNCLITCNTNKTSNTDGKEPYAAGIGISGGVIRETRIVRNVLIEDFKTLPATVNVAGAGVGMSGGGALVNCLVAENVSGAACGGIAVINSAVGITNCTIVGNTAACGGFPGGLCLSKFGTWQPLTNDVSVVNCAFAENLVQGEVSDYEPEAGSITACRSVTRTDFRNPARDDYRPKSRSELVGAGTNAPWMATAVDLYGKPRVFGKTVDIGCAECQSAGFQLIVR